MLKEWLRSSILALIFAVFITSFVLQNAGIITVSFLFKKVQTSLAIVIIVSILVGVICTGIIAFFEQLKLNKKVAELKKKLEEYEPVYKEPTQPGAVQ
jgi:uncharacterized integral membrane protein